RLPRPAFDRVLVARPLRWLRRAPAHPLRRHRARRLHDLRLGRRSQRKAGRGGGPMSNGAAPLGEAEYAELVGRIHSTVAGSVPPGASVLVVSKGDAALLAMPGLNA